MVDFSRRSRDLGVWLVRFRDIFLYRPIRVWIDSPKFFHRLEDLWILDQLQKRSALLLLALFLGREVAQQ